MSQMRWKNNNEYSTSLLRFVLFWQRLYMIALPEALALPKTFVFSIYFFWISWTRSLFTWFFMIITFQVSPANRFCKHIGLLFSVFSKHKRHNFLLKWAPNNRYKLPSSSEMLAMHFALFPLSLWLQVNKRKAIFFCDCSNIELLYDCSLSAYMFAVINSAKALRSHPQIKSLNGN